MRRAGGFVVLLGALLCLYVFPAFKEAMDGIYNDTLLVMFPTMGALEQWYWQAMPLLFLGLLILVTYLQVVKGKGGDDGGRI